MSGDRYEDEPVVGGEVVRRFMVTGGRTRPAGVVELPLETLVSPTDLAWARLGQLQFERRAIVAEVGESASVAEIAARLDIPLRAAVVLVSEMVAEGLLAAESVVDEVDLPLLRKIRAAIAAL